MDGSSLRHDARSCRVAAALAAATAPFDHNARDATWQEGLDLLATVAGMKPLCLLARGPADKVWIATLRGIAIDESLPVVDAPPWDVADESGRLPQWYLAATAARRVRRPALYLCGGAAVADAVLALAARGRATVAEEAALLGYPACCVARHHAQALGLEALIAAMTERLTAGDEARATRLVAAGIEPLPTQAEREGYDGLTAIAPSRWTSVNLCPACVAGDASPARVLERRYAALAARCGYPTA